MLRFIRFILLYLVTCSSLVSCGEVIYSDHDSEDIIFKDHDNAEIIYNDTESARSPKFLFLFPFYRVLPGLPCTTSANLQGVCLSQRQCTARGGMCSGSCGIKGVCCIYQRSCGETTNANITYFISPNYPSAFTAGRNCPLTITRLNTGICQLRLDFLDFSISEPSTTTGTCSDDVLSLGNTNLPRICGENSGQHVYVNFGPGSTSHTITVTTTNTVIYNRRWNIQITQIACNSSTRAPDGCLQYHNGMTGVARSFNYPPFQSSTGSTANRIILGLNYGICVRPEAGYCSIRWSPTTSTSTSSSFTVSTPSANPPDIGSTACTMNYIIIPNGFPAGGTTTADRYCGTSLTAVTTSSMPFVLTFVTSSTQATSTVVLQGFSLSYEQQQCAINAG